MLHYALRSIIIVDTVILSRIVKVKRGNSVW